MASDHSYNLRSRSKKMEGSNIINAMRNTVESPTEEMFHDAPSQSEGDPVYEQQSNSTVDLINKLDAMMQSLYTDSNFGPVDVNAELLAYSQFISDLLKMKNNIINQEQVDIKLLVSLRQREFPLIDELQTMLEEYVYRMYSTAFGPAPAVSALLLFRIDLALELELAVIDQDIENLTYRDIVKDRDTVRQLQDVTQSVNIADKDDLEAIQNLTFKWAPQYSEQAENLTQTMSDSRAVSPLLEPVAEEEIFVQAPEVISENNNDNIDITGQICATTTVDTPIANQLENVTDVPRVNQVPNASVFHEFMQKVQADPLFVQQLQDYMNAMQNTTTTVQSIVTNNNSPINTSARVMSSVQQVTTGAIPKTRLTHANVLPCTSAPTIQVPGEVKRRPARQDVGAINPASAEVFHHPTSSTPLLQAEVLPTWAVTTARAATTAAALKTFTN